MRVVVIAALVASFSSLASATPRTIEARLDELKLALHCADAAAASPAPCQVAEHWSEAKADPIPPGDTALVGLTIEFPDARPATWQPTIVPAIAGFRASKTSSKACAMDMYGDNDDQRAGIVAVKAPLQTALATPAAAVAVPASIAREARELPAGAIRTLTKRGASWTTRFQSPVELRHLGTRWFVIENRQGDSGLWISVFTSDFTVAAH